MLSECSLPESPFYMVLALALRAIQSRQVWPEDLKGHPRRNVIRGPGVAGLGPQGGGRSSIAGACLQSWNQYLGYCIQPCPYEYLILYVGLPNSSAIIQADVYSHGRSEEIIGKALKQFNIPRD